VLFADKPVETGRPGRTSGGPSLFLSWFSSKHLAQSLLASKPRGIEESLCGAGPGLLPLLRLLCLRRNLGSMHCLQLPEGGGAVTKLAGHSGMASATAAPLIGTPLRHPLPCSNQTQSSGVSNSVCITTRMG
jgi:hypothetical protein